MVTDKRIEDKIPEPFCTWLCDLNNALNVLRHNNYDEISIGYAEQVHKTYNREFVKWNALQVKTTLK